MGSYNDAQNDEKFNKKENEEHSTQKHMYFRESRGGVMVLAMN